ncbi:zinc finger protein 260-like [Culex pipiens pallens]|uniref:zinc finger protein 260-like n=1 Tax=Culex pipiens pallens TaxID=42434 RepID=UPI00195361A6|nr:zinc finger protein 260-like [Culex pipiens pallens]
MENLCRTCMSTVDGTDDKCSISVYSDTEMNDTVAGLLNTFCSMEIAPDDPLPKQICPGCVHELLTVINFRRRCEQSEQSLRQLVLEQETAAIAAEAAVIYFEPIEVDHKPDVLQEAEELVGEPEEQDEVLLEQPYSVVEMMSFRCCLCAGILLYSEEEYRGHVQQVHGMDVTEVDGAEQRCVICLRSFESGDELEQHQGKRFMELYQCNSCEDIYESIEDVTQHFGEVHEVSEVQQLPVKPEVEEEPLVEEVPAKKIKLEENSERYCCVTHCHEVFSGEQELIAHAQEKHEIKINHNRAKTEPDKPFTCNVCFRSFGSVKNLKVHQFVRANHNQGKHFSCGHCPFRAVSAALLTVHERSKHSGERPFECPHCEKRFFSELHLKNHLVCHSTARPFPCTSCDRSFSRKRNMEEHIRSCHSEDKPFHCDQCPARFKVPQHLRIHARIHSGEKPYQCQFCTNSYYHISDKKRHEMSHTGVRPYRCETCGAAFTRKRTLTIHERTHTGLRPFKCELCSKGFCQMSTYKKHMERHEGMEAAGMVDLVEICDDGSVESDEGEVVMEEEG